MMVVLDTLEVVRTVQEMDTLVEVAVELEQLVDLLLLELLLEQEAMDPPHLLLEHQ
jgi:hypothetical protein